MLNSIELEIRNTSLRTLCKNNKSFARGVVRTLCATDFCLFQANKANRFSQVAFLFPLDTNEELLECVLDCVENLGEEPASLSITNNVVEATGYSLLIKNSRVIDEICFNSDNTQTWQKAGVVFVDLNKSKKQDTVITTITSELFKRNTFSAVEKFNYLLL